ncbi:putative nucleotidyltransferase substrate binding domain-containing protein [Alteromonas oceanisediminis]|uniref:putative nucleotidyltransferase substrate binding domain-containing protein n=1 Tax=Alteromonas oceanisediminis TaxID=2836180 RepID=UPI001BD96079|nr:putative nucleotidyltransferase substrate binding domain-containing protein [Alteromonas oceanisediminis]MBT0588167.1 CBS domain-containing protein [Alteromonas oceanisediminis]
MSTAPNQIIDFLSASAPFDHLPNNERERIAKQATLIYLTQTNKSVLLAQSQCLFLIQSGQFSVKDSDAPQRHLSEGDYFGIDGLIDRVDYALDVHVDMPGLVLCITHSSMYEAMQSAAFANFFTNAKSEALPNQAVLDSNSMWLHKPLAEVLNKAPVKADQAMDIHRAASLMAEQNVSSLLVTQNGKLVGIVTDRDLRNRVVATAAPLTRPISAVMTEDPVKISHNRTLFDAMSLMGEHNIHHLPVVENGAEKPIGMLTASDIVRHQRGNILFVIGELSKAQNLYELTRASWQIPHYFAMHAKRPGDFDIAGKVLAQATDIMTRKLITFYQQQQGAAPMAYCWVVYGSQAREDQSMGSDQDNALLLAHRPDRLEAEYFSGLANYVCNGLAKCGIALCSGNIMASNPDLRLSLDDAIEEARQWVRQPTPKAIMTFNIFLDARAAAGDTALFKRLQAARAPLLQQRSFLAALARHNNHISVPLSVFQKFVFEKGGNDEDAIDLKKNAVAIINNIVRLYALASAVSMPSTLARLDNLPETAGLVRKDAENLRDIWLFLNRLRWRHQLTRNVVDNRVSMSELSSIEKHQLKAAFKAIDRAQQAAVMKYSGGIS